jgi:hypothetical protein
MPTLGRFLADRRTGPTKRSPPTATNRPPLLKDADGAGHAGAAVAVACEVLLVAILGIHAVDLSRDRDSSPA